MWFVLMKWKNTLEKHAIWVSQYVEMKILTTIERFKIIRKLFNISQYYVWKIFYLIHLKLFVYFWNEKFFDLFMENDFMEKINKEVFSIKGSDYCFLD